jgi:quercetin dioxygenase-like cupin family protein
MRLPVPKSARRPSVPSLLLGIALLLCLTAAADRSSERHPEEREGSATILHRADVVRPDGRHLWSLYSSPEARMNYFEVVSRTGLHFHPDADHRLYVLEGKLVVTVGTNTATATAGDFIVIPRGVRHSYDVSAPGERALLLTFDAPPYDPRKTVNLEPANRP